MPQIVRLSLINVYFNQFPFIRTLLINNGERIICYNSRKGEIHHEKILSLLLLVLAVFLLVSCSSQNNLDGNYYWIDTENGLRNELSFTVKGTAGTIEKGEYDKFTINSKNNTFELSGDDASAKEVTYKHSDGVITVDISGTEHEYYKEGTDAHKEAVKKYNELQN